jgi:hypothetical protein
VIFYKYKKKLFKKKNYLKKNLFKKKVLKKNLFGVFHQALRAVSKKRPIPPMLDIPFTRNPGGGVEGMIIIVYGSI